MKQLLLINFIYRKCIYFSFGGHIRQCSRLTPNNEFRDHFKKCSGDPMLCWVLNCAQLCTRQAS